MNNPLGKPVDYRADHPLFPIARKIGRANLRIAEGTLPFTGFDAWNAWELSWLNERGKPVVATGVFIFPADSPFLIESKSLKLFLNGLHQRRFHAQDEVGAYLKQALSEASQSQVKVTLTLAPPVLPQRAEEGVCLDGIDCPVDVYDYNPSLLQTTEGVSDQAWYSHLFKSNCPVTGQPDWGCVAIRCRGPNIVPESLLRYLVSFRQHSEFHEQCVERIFCDLLSRCRPERLSVWARYTRRGGLDINPVRSNDPEFVPDLTLAWRQ